MDSVGELGAAVVVAGLLVVLVAVVVLVVLVVMVEGLVVKVGEFVVPELEAAVGVDEHWLTSPPSEKQVRCPGKSSLS